MNPKMKTSFSTLACPDWDLSEVIAAAVRYGYDGVELRVLSNELNLWNLPEFQPSLLSTTYRSIQDQGLSVACMGSSAVFHSSSAQERERNLDSALRMADIAVGLGAPAIRVFGDRVQAGNGREDTEVWIAESLLKLAERLEPKNIQVWLETHGDFTTASEVGELVAGISNREVGLIWDPANAFAQSGDAPLIPSSISDRIRHVHLKDLVREGSGGMRYVLSGEGEFPFETMFASLHEISFSGFVSFEWEKLWHSELSSPEVALPHFTNWWKNAFKRW
jgi:sugar phosphate isomerase/epimerase